MCLDSLEKFAPCKYGYQLKIKKPRKHKVMKYFNVYSPYRGVSYMKGAEYEAEGRDIIFYADKARYRYQYPAGFHLFHSYKDAVEWNNYFPKPRSSAVIVKAEVLYGKTTTGRQGPYKVTVANKVKFIEHYGMFRYLFYLVFRR